MLKDHKKKLNRELKISRRKAYESDFKNSILFRLIQNIHYSFPDLFLRLRNIEDFRSRPQYELAELIFGAIAIFIFKSGSRNAFNNMNQEKFALNYYRAFKMKLPHTDTINIAMKIIKNDELEALKSYLIKGLVQKKIFYKYRILGQYYNISVDGTSLMKINPANIANFPHALYKVYNKGKENEKTVYFINILEAKLICSNGFCISLGTEWIENPLKEYNKQDCELKAFTRLMGKLKQNFPRLPMCIVGDGLYPNETVFKICKNNNWNWIFTFKDGNLPSIWEEVEGLHKFQEANSRTVTSRIFEKDSKNKIVEKEVIKVYSWIQSIDYRGYKVSLIKLIETVEGEIKHEFVYISNLTPSYETILEIANNGRLRFKIENEGFNTQKNNGYNASHKYSESSEAATKNYYTCLQIGHAINQLLELQESIKHFVKGRNTVKNLWSLIISFFTVSEINQGDINNFLKIKRQYRFE